MGGVRLWFWLAPLAALDKSRAAAQPPNTQPTVSPN